MTVDVRFAPYGDAGVLVSFRGFARTQRWTAAQSLAVQLEHDPLPGLVDVVATFEDVFVAFDPLLTTHDDVITGLRRALMIADPTTFAMRPRRFVVPVRYGGEHGPDLDEVARELGLSPAELIGAHTAAEWTVRFRASPVGAPFLETDSVPPWPAPVARLPQPRVRVEPGSVGLSGQQCIVYPVLSPGGWRIIARTPLALVDTDDPDLVAYRAGDVIRFEAVDADGYAARAGMRLPPLAGRGAA